MTSPNVHGKPRWGSLSFGDTMALLDDLAGYLQAQGLGIVGADIFKGGLAVNPVAQYGLVETGGGIPLRELDNTLPVDTPGVQVLSRDMGYDLCSARAWAAYYAFDAVLEQPIGTAVYKVTEPVAAPAILEWVPLEGEQRPVFVFNLIAEVHRG